jgi:peptidoglycan/LPS O-acetylase OafA/YrhL
MKAARSYPLGYRGQLDVLRAAAIFGVVMYHAGRAEARFAGGYLGVDLFFVLRGR